MIILTFHGIGSPSRVIDANEQRVWLSGEQFERVLDAVNRQLNVTITFDDGNRSDVTIALPALLRRGMHASFFVVADRIGKEGFLSGDDLIELAEAGMDIGSHGMSHVPWRGLAPDVLNGEIVGARDILQRTVGRPVRSAACPFGAYDGTSLRALRRAGFERVFTSDRQPADADKFLQSRYTLHADDSPDDIEAIVSGCRRRPAWLHNLRCTLKQWPLLAR